MNRTRMLYRRDRPIQARFCLYRSLHDFISVNVSIAYYNLLLR
ncbi:hypothetical protein ACQ4M4_26750 [Leptolyngbya sp. AN02str]